MVTLHLKIPTLRRPNVTWADLPHIQPHMDFPQHLRVHLSTLYVLLCYLKWQFKILAYKSNVMLSRSGAFRYIDIIYFFMKIVEHNILARIKHRITSENFLPIVSLYWDKNATAACLKHRIFIVELFPDAPLSYSSIKTQPSVGSLYSIRKWLCLVSSFPSICSYCSPNLVLLFISDFSLSLLNSFPWPTQWTNIPHLPSFYATCWSFVQLLVLDNISQLYKNYKLYLVII